MDGTSFMGSRLRIEHARDSRDSRRDGGRWSPPRGRFSWVLLFWIKALCIVNVLDIFSSRGNPPGRRTGYRTIVENLSSRTSWQDLKDFMRKVTNNNNHRELKLLIFAPPTVMNLTVCYFSDPLCVIILKIIFATTPKNNWVLNVMVTLQAGEITYTNTNQPRVGEGIVEFGSRFA